MSSAPPRSQQTQPALRFGLAHQRSPRRGLSRRPLGALLILTLLGGSLCSQAFPPAPYYSIYGDVRDKNGTLLPNGAATIVLAQGAREVLRESLVDSAGGDFNYQVRMRIDMLRPSTTTYSSLSMNPGSVYTVAIEIGGQLYYPIEMATPPAVGNPAERRRIDLTLGVDADKDGLPDAWEEAQLYQAGYLPGANGWDLSLIDRNGDLDHDGISNWAEYIAGTYAGDSSSIIVLKIKEILATSVRLEFYAIYGRVYRVESSSDLQTWSPVNVSLASPAAGEPVAAQASLSSKTTGVMSIYAEATSGPTFYRLIAR